MRSRPQATLYPGVGLLETTNVSVGRGTDTPFELIGAPWIVGQQLAAALNQRSLPGVRFVPVRFKPSASVFKGEECQGINVIIIDRATFRPVLTGIEIAVALRRLYPEQWKVEGYGRLLVNAATLERVKRSDAAQKLCDPGMSNWINFSNIRARSLLY